MTRPASPDCPHFGRMSNIEHSNRGSCAGICGVKPVAKQRRAFNPTTFLSTVGAGREMMSFRKGQIIFAQGDASDAVFVIQSGNVRLSARSQRGKEATLDILGDKDFVGKDSIAGQPIRTASAIALTNCQLLRIERTAMMLALEREVLLSKAFCAYVLARNIRYQQDLLDQRCNSSEKRLAGILLRYSHFGGQSSPEAVVKRINHEILAEMVGTTRSRVCFFMTRFKDAGYIEYTPKNPQLRVRRSLLAFYAR
jgi:CRP/FNR family cyclic AMP-dependent transcriptional regulator